MIFTIMFLMDGLNEIDKLIQSEEDRKKLLGVIPRQIEAREYFTAQNPAYAEIMRRTKDIQLLDFQTHAQYATQASRSRFDVMGALRLGALGVRNAFRRSHEAFGPVQFSQTGYESTWASDIKLAGGFAEYPYNVRPGMAMAMGYESFSQRVSRIPGVGMAAGAQLGAYMGTSALVTAAMGGTGAIPMIAGVAAGIGAETVVTRAMNPALRAQTNAYGNWLQQVDWRLKPGPSPTMRGVGFSAGERSNIASSLATMPYYQPGVSREMVDISLQGGMQMGMYGGVGSGAGLTKRATEIATALRDVTRTLNQSFTEGMQTISQLKTAGVPYARMGPTAEYISGAARTAGVSYAQMIGAAGVGAEMARSIRMPGATGISAAMQGVWMSQAIARGGLMTGEQIAQAGGTEAIAQTLTYQATAGMRQRGVVRLIGAAYQQGGGLSREILDRYTAGSLSSKEIGNLYQKNVLATKTAQYEFAENLPKLIGTLDPTTRLSIQMTAYQKQAKAAGLDVNNQAAFTSYLRNMGVPNPEAVLAAAQITPQEMHGAIYSDIKYQERLDRAAEGGGGLGGIAKGIGRAWRWRGKSVVSWGAQQAARVEDKLTSRRLQSLGVYDIGMDPIYEPTSAEFSRLYGKEASTTMAYASTVGATGLTRDVIGDIRYESLIPTGAGGGYFAPPGRGRGGDQAYFKDITGRMRPTSPEGWRESAKMIVSSKADVKNEEFQKILNKGLSVTTESKLDQLRLQQRGGMLGDVVALTASKHIQAGLALGGPLAMYFGGKKVQQAYHSLHKSNMYLQKEKFMEATNSIAQDQYGMNFDQLQSDEKKKAVIKLADMKVLSDVIEKPSYNKEALTAAAATKQKDAIMTTWKGNMERSEKWGSKNRKFMQWMNQGNRWSRIPTLAAQFATESSGQEKKRLSSEMIDELGPLVAEFGDAGLGKVNMYDIYQRAKDPGKFGDGREGLSEAAKMLEMERVAYQKTSMSNVKSYASGVVEEFAGKKGYELAKETMETLEVYEGFGVNFLRDVDAGKLKASPAYKKDKRVKLIADMSESIQKLDKIQVAHEAGTLKPSGVADLRKIIKGLEGRGYEIPTWEGDEGGVRYKPEELIGLAAGIFQKEMGGYVSKGPLVGEATTIGEAKTIKELYDSAVMLKESVDLLKGDVDRLSKKIR